MHRHGYKGRKFGRETDQRQALLRGLMCSLIKYQSINTTLARAKELRRPLEKLITLAKNNSLASRRLLIARLNDIETADFLIDVVAPQIQRNSGYLRIEHAGFRKGDHAEMAIISFVDSIDPELKLNTSAQTSVKKTDKADAKANKTAKAPKAPAKTTAKTSAEKGNQ